MLCWTLGIPALQKLFKNIKIAIQYFLGNYCTAKKKVWAWTLLRNNGAGKPEC